MKNSPSWIRIFFYITDFMAILSVSSPFMYKGTVHICLLVFYPCIAYNIGMY